MARVQPLKLGFVGGGSNSVVGYVHYAAAQLDDAFEIVAGCFSRDPAVNHHSAVRYGVVPERVYPDADALLAAEAGELDAIAVLTPTPDHFDVARKCLSAGVSVICEKALADSGDRAQELVALARRERRVLAVMYNYAGYPMLRALRARVARGELGRIHGFRIAMPQEQFMRRRSDGWPKKPQDWRLRDGEIPTVYLDLGTHVHHVLVYLLGEEPTDVVASEQNNGAFPGIVDTVTAIARCPGGASGTLTFDKTSLGDRNGLTVRLQGDRLAVEWQQTEPEIIRAAGVDGQRYILDRASDDPPDSAVAECERFKPGHPAGFLEAFANTYGDIRDMLLGRPAEPGDALRPNLDGEVAVRGLRLLESMVRSARTETWCRTDGI